MKIFLTGGTGFIGSYVLRTLVKNKNMDIVAARRKTSPMDLVKDIEGIEWRECNLLDVVQIEEIIRGCDTVVHIAGSVTFSSWKQDQIFKSNVDITANLVNVALESKVNRFIHFSSVAALGLSSKLIDEAQVWAENNSKSYYSLSKYLGEKEAWRGFAEGLNVSIINPAFTIGSGLWDEGPMSIISKIDQGLKYYPTGSNGIVDVRDVADMCLKLLDNTDLAGRRFICSGHNVSHYHLMSMMCDSLGKPHPSKPLSGVLGQLAWRGASLAARLQGKESLLSKEAYTIASAHLTYDNSQSVGLLGMQYKPLQQTIDDTIACYKKSKDLGGNFAMI
ncbi:MAG: NAD-dependent epimerase/dehydratase family protein [Saprospiraceae bacterium]